MIQSRADLSEVDEQACLQSPTLTNLYGEKPRVSKQQVKLVVKESSEAALLRLPALNHPMHHWCFIKSIWCKKSY